MITNAESNASSRPCTQKLAVREHVKALGLGHTFIDVGWWMQLYLPLPLRSAAGAGALKMSRHVYGPGDSRTLLTDLDHIGVYVARILADPRTLGRAVQVWEDERTQLEAREIGERASGDGDALKSLRVLVGFSRGCIQLLCSCTSCPR